MAPPAELPEPASSTHPADKDAAGDAPVVVLDDKVFGRMTSAKTKKLIEDKE